MNNNLFNGKKEMSKISDKNFLQWYRIRFLGDKPNVEIY